MFIHLLEISTRKNYVKNINFHEKPWSGERLIKNDKKKQGLRSNYLSIGKISFASRIKYEKCVCILTN